jgi:WD40 repeat protein
VDYKLLPGDREVSRIGSVLALASSVLEAHHEQLEMQLCGRLVGNEGRDIADLLTQIRQRSSSLLLPPNNGFLTHPGSGAHNKNYELCVNAIAPFGGGRWALSGSNDSFLRLWDLESGIELLRFAGHAKAILAVAVSLDGRRAISASEDHTLRIWDLGSGAELNRFETGTYPIDVVEILRDGRRALLGHEGVPEIWNIETGERLHRFANGGERLVAVLSQPNGICTVSDSTHSSPVWGGLTQTKISVRNLETGEERVFEKPSGGVTSIAFAADGVRALVGGYHYMGRYGSTRPTLELVDITTGNYS